MGLLATQIIIQINFCMVLGFEKKKILLNVESLQKPIQVFDTF